MTSALDCCCPVPLLVYSLCVYSCLFASQERCVYVCVWVGFTLQGIKAVTGEQRPPENWLETERKHTDKERQRACFNFLSSQLHPSVTPQKISHISHTQMHTHTPLFPLPWRLILFSVSLFLLLHRHRWFQRYRGHQQIEGKAFMEM